MKSATHWLQGTLPWNVVLSATLLSACVGGQTGGEDAVPPSLPFPGASRNACAVAATPTVLASIDETSPAGFSAATVLQYAEGTFNEPLHFFRQPNDWFSSTPLSIEPGGDETLEVEIRYAGGELRYFAPAPETSSICRGRLEIDVQVTLRTPSGALDERIDGALMASSASAAQLWLRFHTSAVQLAEQPVHLELPVVAVHRLSGDLSVTGMDDDGRQQLAFIELWLTLSELGASGDLDGWIYGQDRGGLSLLSGLATIGETCARGYRGYPLGAEDPAAPGEMAPSAREVLSVLEQMQVDAVRDDGTRLPLSLDLEYTADSACSRPGDDTPLTFEALLSIAADVGDARIDGRWPLELRARTASNGALASVHATFVQPGEVSLDSSELESLADDWGVTGLELDGYDAVSMTFDLSVQPATDPPAVAGDLFIRGYTLPEDMSRPLSTQDGDVLGHLSFEAAPSL